MEDRSPWNEMGWASTDPARIAEWKSYLEGLMASNPHEIGAMSPQPGRPCKAVDARGMIPGFTVAIRESFAATLRAPEDFIPMAGWAASSLFAAMDSGPAEIANGKV